MHYKSYVYVKDLENIEANVKKAMSPFRYEKFKSEFGSDMDRYAWDWYEIGGRWIEFPSPIPVEEITDETAFAIFANGEYVNIEKLTVKQYLNDNHIDNGYLVVVDFHS